MVTGNQYCLWNRVYCVNIKLSLTKINPLVFHLVQGSMLLTGRMGVCGVLLGITLLYLSFQCQCKNTYAFFVACVGSETQKSLRWDHFNIPFYRYDNQLLRKYLHNLNMGP